VQRDHPLGLGDRLAQLPGVGERERGPLDRDVDDLVVEWVQRGLQRLQLGG
jgi:hypothetical protein